MGGSRVDHHLDRELFMSVPEATIVRIRLDSLALLGNFYTNALALGQVKPLSYCFDDARFYCCYLDYLIMFCLP